MPPLFDLMVPEHAYIFGFLQSDGHMSKGTRNRGKIRIEVNAGDRALLEAIQEIVHVNSSIQDRTRDTNFKDGAESSVWTACDQGFRETLLGFGLPYGRKSAVVAPPSVSFSNPDYFRGLLDGDGSLGLTGQGFPFLGWCTSSPPMAEALTTFLHGITGKRKEANPNARDSAYNVTVWKEDAQEVARVLYYEGCLALERKRESSCQVLAWTRPESMRKVTWEKRRWSPEEDDVVLDHDTPEAMRILGRTATSINVRRWRLNANLGG